MMFLYLLVLASPVVATNFIFSNNCDYDLWPGLYGDNLSTTGFALPAKSQLITVSTPAPFSGRIWARTLCSQYNPTNFTCVTADCRSGKIECDGRLPTGAVTLVEFSLASGQDFYDVSLVQGFNVPILVYPTGNGTGQDCKPTGCSADLTSACPAELKVVVSSGPIACRSACDAFNREHYCCTGEYSTPSKCGPTVYSRLFKSVCPRAYSYAFDDATTTFSCGSSPDYLITFCASPLTT